MSFVFFFESKKQKLHYECSVKCTVNSLSGSVCPPQHSRYNIQQLHLINLATDLQFFYKIKKVLLKKKKSQLIFGL